MTDSGATSLSLNINGPYGVFTLSDTDNETDTDGITKSSQWD